MIFLVLDQANLRARWRSRRRAGAFLLLATWALLRPPMLDPALGYAIGGTFIASGVVRIAAAVREGPLYWRWYLAHGAVACLLGAGLVAAHTASNPTPVVFAAAIEALLTAFGYARLGAFGRRRAASGSAGAAYGGNARDGPARRERVSATSVPPG